jgi:hypothetical protein
MPRPQLDRLLEETEPEPERDDDDDDDEVVFPLVRRRRPAAAPAAGRPGDRNPTRRGTASPC